MDSFKKIITTWFSSACLSCYVIIKEYEFDENGTLASDDQTNS